VNETITPLRVRDPREPKRLGPQAVTEPAPLQSVLQECETVRERMLLLAVRESLERLTGTMIALYTAGKLERGLEIGTGIEPLLVAWSDATGCAWREKVSHENNDE
jgi:hypothetical protein